jgi:hypothetical protein
MRLLQSLSRSEVQRWQGVVRLLPVLLFNIRDELIR